MKRKENRTSAHRTNATAKIAQLQAKCDSLAEEMDRLRVSARLSSRADFVQQQIIKSNEEKARKAQLIQEAQRRAASPTRQKQPRRSLDDLEKQRSLLQVEAANELGVSDRQVRYLIKNGSLTRTASKRVAVDARFLAEYRRQHG